MTNARLLLAGADGLLIDLDGTLVDSTAAVRRAWTAFARRHGLDPRRTLERAHGCPAPETVRALAPPAEVAAEIRLMEDAEVFDTAGVHALPGSVQLLHSRRALAIVTSCSARLARARLSAAGLPEPPVMVSYDDVTRGKPDPEPFLTGAARLGLEPRRCLVLEDAPAGIVSARAAGMRVIALRTTHADSELRDADEVVDDLGALLGRDDGG